MTIETTQHSSLEDKLAPDNLREQIKRVIEALLFSSDAPLSLDDFCKATEDICPLHPTIIKSIVEDLRHDYTNGGFAFQIDELAHGYLLRTQKMYAPYIIKFFNDKRPLPLSKAATEVLAIVAYRQPVMRVEIDRLRGVDSSGTLQILVERELVTSTGKLDLPGRPKVYSTTENFLSYYGLKTFKDLPDFETL